MKCNASQHYVRGQEVIPGTSVILNQTFKIPGYRCVVVVTVVLRWLRLCCDGYGCVVVVTDVL